MQKGGLWNNNTPLFLSGTVWTARLKSYLSGLGTATGQTHRQEKLFDGWRGVGKDGKLVGLLNLCKSINDGDRMVCSTRLTL